MTTSELTAFVNDVRARASRHPEGSPGRFGRHKVYIASLNVDRTRLVEAHRAGLLRLCRADLVCAMDQELVEASETRYLNAEFHLLDTEGWS